MQLTRSDADSEIASYSTILPAGVTANLTGVPFCPEADIELARHKTGAQEESEPSCPAGEPDRPLARRARVSASVLDYVPGALYFAGPFHGEPYSVVSVTSATIGPFDLGTVVIRFGLHIDPYTAQVIDRSDRLGTDPDDHRRDRHARPRHPRLDRQDRLHA